MSPPDTIAPDAWLHQLESQIALVRELGSPSSVHQMRVAAGRLSVWLEIGGRTALRDDLRWLRRSAMSVRDADVMLGSSCSDAWRAMLIETRARELADARAELARSRVSAILIGLSYVPWPSRELALSGALRLARRTLRAGDDLGRDERDATTFHRLRRRVRRTRYALEWLELDATHVKTLQDVLGRLNDATVALAHGDTLQREQFLAVDRSALEAEHERLRAEALAAWSSQRLELKRLAHGDGI